jgi:hypothetical protein
MTPEDQANLQLRNYSEDEGSRPSSLEIAENLSNDVDDSNNQDMNRSPAVRWLLTSHFLSTWNSRVFEFSAILFIAVIFPGSLLPASLYALARSGAAILFAPSVGRYIDSSNRLQTVRYSIGK